MTHLFDIAQLRRLRGLLRLAEAAAEADAIGTDRWQYAVDRNDLYNHTGLTSDVQWLVGEGLVERRIETTRAGARMRTFRQTAKTNGDRVVFILSSAGVRSVRRLLENGDISRKSSHDVPHWDGATGDWTLAGALVKHLGTGATTQRRLLDVCQSCEWANPVDNPFDDTPPRQRGRYLSRLLNDLNSNQREARIHFSSCDKALRVRWRSVVPG